MSNLKTFIICTLLVIAAFAAGYGLGYRQWKKAEKVWTVAKSEMAAKIGNLEKELVRAKARDSLLEMAETFSQIITHLSEKNFGLAGKTVEGLKETFATIRPHLDEEWKTKFAFLLPALEEIKKEVETLSLTAKKKAEEIKSHFEQSLKPAKKG